MTPTSAALVDHSLQVGLVVGTATAGAWLTRARTPRLHLALWRATALACALLPLLGAAMPVSDASVAFGAVRVVSTSARSAPGLDWLWAAVVWIVVTGIAVRLVWNGVGLRRLALLRRDSEPAVLTAGDEELRRTVAPHADVRWTDRLPQPVTFGLVHPTVFLPRSASALSDDARRAVLCHELMHVSRHDWAWIAVEEIARSVYWFHPAVWWLLDRVHLCREEVIDGLVVERTSVRRPYMEALVRFAEAAPMALPAAPMLRRRHLLSRLRHLSEEPHMSRSRTTWIAAGLLVVVVGSASLIAVRAFPVKLGALAAVPASQERLEKRLRPTPWASLSGGQQRQADRAAPAQDDAARTVLPSVVSEQKPSYTPQAMEAKIQGEVLLKVQVRADGTVGSVSVVRSLDKEYGLDRSAVAAAKQWRFKPGTRDGKPVPVTVDLQMRFTLK